MFNELNNPSNPILNYEDDIENDRQNTTINLDYVNPLNEKSKLEIGLESRIRNMKNSRITTQQQYIYDEDPNSPTYGEIIGIEPVPDSKYNYNRDINSAYVNFSQKFDKLSYQVGARLESYKVNAEYNGEDIFEDDILTVYPSAFVTYNSSEKNQFQVSYSRRVDRPSFQQVNPIREWSTPQITAVGNPELDPQYTNSIELNYTRNLKNGSITFGTFYRIINDNITRLLFEDPFDENRVVLTFGNTDNNNAYGIELSSNYRFTNWWDVNASFDLYHQTEKE